MVNMKLINGNCIEKMAELIDDGIKVDLVLTDPPYGTTQCKWDSIIPFDEMWNCIHGLVNPNTPILLFGQEPFSSHLRLSNLKEYRYDWIWNKTYGTNFLNANRMPMPCHEVISVFYQRLPYYNPQKKYVGQKYDKIRKGGLKQSTYGKVKVHSDYIDDGFRFPLSVIEYNNNKGETSQSKRIHPTQKPIKLMEYFIKTYSKENDLILDFTMGGGTTGVACRNLNRDFIGIELDKKYYDIAVDRINNYQGKLL